MENIRDEQDILKIYKSGLYELKNRRFKAKNAKEVENFDKMIKGYEQIIKEHEVKINDSGSDTVSADVVIGDNSISE